MSLTPSIGTTISYSDSLPQTYDQSGFENLSFTELGNVESIPQLGTQKNTNSYTPVGTGTISYYKTTTDHPEMTVPVSFSDDAALEAMRTARDSDSEISFLVEYNDAPNGGTASARYFAAFVTGVMDEVGGADGIIMAQVMLRPQPSTYVEVAAAAGN